VGSVDRLTYVELIEAQKARLSPEALELWKELDESHFFSNEADHFINEDFTTEEAITFQRHQRRQLDILGRWEKMPQDDRRVQRPLMELRAGLSRSDEAESRGEPAQQIRDKCVITASIIKDRDTRGPGGPPRGEEFEGRTVEQALARLMEPSQPEALQDAPEAPQTAEQEPEWAEPRPAAPGAQEGAQKPWWRRVFGG
jgi:hypothetical protein